jgi:hypothetical protein
MGKAAGQGCRTRLPGKAAGQGCRARLPGKAAGQGWEKENSQSLKSCLPLFIILELEKYMRK